MGDTVAKREELWPQKSKPWENGGRLWFAGKNQSCKYNSLKIMLSFNKHIKESDGMHSEHAVRTTFPFITEKILNLD